LSVSWFGWSVNLFDPDPSPPPYLGLAWESLPSLIACPFLSRSLSRPLRCCTTPTPLCCVHGWHAASRQPSAFVELPLNLFFSQRLLTLPLLAATCRVCRVEPCLAFADSPAITIPLCTTPLPLLVFSFFLSSLKCCYHYHYNRHHHHHLRLRLLPHARFLFFYRHSRHRPVLDKL